MPSPFHPDYNPLVRKTESDFTLTDDERQAHENLPMQVAVLTQLGDPYDSVSGHW